MRSTSEVPSAREPPHLHLKNTLTLLWPPRSTSLHTGRWSIGQSGPNLAKLVELEILSNRN